MVAFELPDAASEPPPLFAQADGARALLDFEVALPTGVAVETALRLPTVVDRPFAFALIDNATDAPLFLGVVGDL